MIKKKIVVFSLSLKACFVVLCVFMLVGGYLKISRNSDIEIAEDGLESNVNVLQVDTYDNFGYTPLMMAALQGVSTTVADLIRAGVNLDAKSKNKDLLSGQIAGNTALMFAVYGSNFDGPYECANLLIDAGANVRVVNDDFGYTAVHFLQQVADINKRGSLLARLIKAGANPNAQDKNGNTLLYFTTMNERQGWVEYLKKNFASVIDFHVSNFKSQTPAQYAASLGYGDVVDVFNSPGVIVGVNNGRVNDAGARDSMMGMTGFMLSLIKKDVNRAQQFLKINADINAKVADNKQNSSLHLMFLQQMPDMVTFLVNNKANVNITNADGDSALQYVLKLNAAGSINPGAYIADRNNMAKLLLDKQADINHQNNNGDTLLHQMVKRNPNDNAQPLLDFIINNYAARINLDVKNEQGFTALQLAKELNRASMVNSLMRLSRAREFVPATAQPARKPK